MAHPTRGDGLLEGFLARLRARRADALISPSSRHGRILDIGCGSFPLFLSRASFNSKYGIDRVIDPESIRELAGQGMTLQPIDLEAGEPLPFKDDYFDVVAALAVFEHIAQDRLVPVLQEVHRVLKDGGQFVMTTPSRGTEGILSAMARLRLVSSEEIDEHKGAYSRSEIADVLSRAGFPPAAIRSGHFELFMNTWVSASK